LCAIEPDATIAQLLENPAAVESDEGRARLQRAAAVLMSALQEKGRHRLRDWIERTWNSLNGAATLTTTQDLEDAQSYFARLSEIEAGGDIDDIARLEGQLDRLFATPRADETARVDVMTIHKAKGLEFDTVILPMLHRGVRRESTSLLRWTRIAGTHGGIVLAPMKAQGADHGPTYDWIGLLEEQRSQHERGRLLYVAATRAKRELHLLGAADVKEGAGDPELRRPRRGSMLAMLWSEVIPQYLTALQSRMQLPLSFADSGPALLLRRLPLGWQPEIAENAPQSRETLDFISPPPFDWVSETSRHIGTLVHRELDRMSRRGDPLAGVLSLQRAQGRLAIELAELGVPADRCNAAVARVIEAIESTLADTRGRWLMGLEEPLTAVESELSLSGVIDARIVNIVIDRTFIAADGTRWIVDFKTSSHEGGGLEQFLDAEVERYRLQLSRYTHLMRALNPAEQVKAALYFPLLQAWREVSDSGTRGAVLPIPKP
jgi:ATP-dependent exoDNAse (exonuclease V) beta subunit